MHYFRTLPLIVTKDPYGKNIAAVNLLARSSIVQSLLNNPAIFYQYDIKDGDTPEIIANKYYNDPYRYWLVLFANQIIDPQWQWPLTYNEFSDYINDKYAAAANTANVTPLAYTQSTVYEYRKTVVTYDTASQTTTSNNYVIDLATYNSTVQGSETVQFYDTNGNVTDTATYTVSTQIVYIYDWEVEQNESNRTINLLNSAFVGDFEKQFKSLMSR
jgi:hypothetical protein